MSAFRDRPVLQARGIRFAYLDGIVLKGISLELWPGELVGLIGPNGSGKTTLLRVLSGVLSPQEGEVLLGGRDLRRLSRRQIARRIGVVPQELAMPYAFTCREMVMLGRTPYARPLAWENRRDRKAVEEAMALTNTLPLAQRPFNELSGGERQRVIIAMALAQEPEVLLMDEPTVHLDINHQVEVMELIRHLAREKGLAVLAVFHDLNLAAHYSERLLLLNGGRIYVQGSPQEVMTPHHIRRAFGAEVVIQPHPLTARPTVLPSFPLGRV